MKLIKKITKGKGLALAVATGLVCLSVAPASFAGFAWHFGFHTGTVPAAWQWRGTTVHQRGCRRVVVRRYCRVNMWGNRQCFRTRSIRWEC